jgi:hypothetical protein
MQKKRESAARFLGAAGQLAKALPPPETAPAKAKAKGAHDPEAEVTATDSGGSSTASFAKDDGGSSTAGGSGKASIATGGTPGGRGRTHQTIV